MSTPPVFGRSLPMTIALAMVAAVWLGGAVWSFEEQAAFAAAAGFLVPLLLPLTLDGLALSLASVAWAASLDGRAAVQARIGTAVAIASSAGSNARWAWERTSGGAGEGDVSAVILAAGVPVASFLAFEVLLAELRRQVHRRRGLPAPVAVPHPRLIRLALAPISTFGEWRREVLQITALRAPEPEAPPIAVPVETPPPSAPPVRPIRRKTAAAAPRRKAVTAKVSDDDLMPRMRQLVADGKGRPTIMRELAIGSDRYDRLRKAVDASGAVS